MSRISIHVYSTVSINDETFSKSINITDSSNIIFWTGYHETMTGTINGYNSNN